jgi:hypothetical protein
VLVAICAVQQSGKPAAAAGRSAGLLPDPVVALPVVLAPGGVELMPALPLLLGLPLPLSPIASLSLIWPLTRSKHLV